VKRILNCFMTFWTSFQGVRAEREMGARAAEGVLSRGLMVMSAIRPLASDRTANMADRR
jgi:hypothetical protein